MSLKCACESILKDKWCLCSISLTKRKAIFKLCKKEIPKQIRFDHKDLNICPVCLNHVNTDDKYCRNCGQRIFLE